MAKQEILNLDKFVPEPRTLILDGKEYKVASDLSVGDALKIMKRWSEYQESSEEEGMSDIEGVLEQVWKFFEPYNPDLSKEDLRDKIRIKHIGPLVQWLYQGIMEFSEEDPEIEPEEDPKKKGTQAPE